MLDRESARRQTPQVSRATGDVVDTATGRALEMMVMRQLPHLVAPTLSWQGDDLDGTFSDEQL